MVERDFRPASRILPADSNATSFTKLRSCTYHSTCMYTMYIIVHVCTLYSLSRALKLSFILSYMHISYIIYVYIHTYMHVCVHTHTDRQTDRQTDRHTHTHTHQPDSNKWCTALCKSLSYRNNAATACSRVNPIVHNDSTDSSSGPDPA